MAPFGLGTRKESLTSLRCGRSLMRESWARLRLCKRFVHILDKSTAELLVFVYFNFFLLRALIFIFGYYI